MTDSDTNQRSSLVCISVIPDEFYVKGIAWCWSCSYFHQVLLTPKITSPNNQAMYKLYLLDSNNML